MARRRSASAVGSPPPPAETRTASRPSGIPKRARPSSRERSSTRSRTIAGPVKRTADLAFSGTTTCAASSRLGNEDPVVERQHRLEVGAPGELVLHRAVDEDAGPRQVERGDELAEGAVRERVDDEDVGAEEAERVPDPLLGEREVGELVDAGRRHGRSSTAA